MWEQIIPGVAYLALPYTGAYGANCPRYRLEKSFRIANAVAARLMEGGEIVFSPISHSHPISNFMVYYEQDHDFWMAQNEPMMSMCNRIYVIKIDGWRKSSGVRLEIDWFKKHDLPIFLLDIGHNSGEILLESMKQINGHGKLRVEQLGLFPN